MKTREHATVTYARAGKNADYGVPMLEMGFDFGSSHQGLGGLCLNEDVLPKVEAEICALFGVATIAETVGRQCFVLRCWPHLNEPVEGIEVDGRRWTVSATRRRFFPTKYKDRLTERTESIQASIDRHAAEVRRDVEHLRRVREGYVDWSAAAESFAPEEP